MVINIKNILKYLENSKFKFNFIGNLNINISRYSSINSIKEGSISWVKNKDYYNEIAISQLKNILLVINSDIDIKSDFLIDKGFIICDNPKEIFFSILNNFFPPEQYRSYISSSSVILSENIGTNVYIGHNCFIGKDVSIGNDVVIKNNVSIEGKVIIGNNTIIHSGVVIGSDGYGYYQNEEGKNIKVPHYGGVVIGQNVEIGANTCIDRGTLDDTIIGNNVKIDNLCHIGHNCIIKDNSSIVALSMLGGSAIIEENSYIAPGVMIKNQLKIGENSLIGIGAVVIKDVEKNKVVAGVPAKVIRENL